METTQLLWNNPRVRRRHTNGEVSLVLDNFFIVIDDRIDAVWSAAATPGTAEQIRDRTALRLQLDQSRANVVTRAALDALMAEHFIVRTTTEYVTLYEQEPWAEPSR